MRLFYLTLAFLALLAGVVVFGLFQSLRFYAETKAGAINGAAPEPTHAEPLFFMNKYAVLVGTPLWHMADRVIGVVNKSGRLYAVVLPSNASRPAKSLEVYDVATGGYTPSSTAVMSDGKGGILYRVYIEGGFAEIRYNAYCVTWRIDGRDVATACAAGYFAVSPGKEVAGAVSASWVEAKGVKPCSIREVPPHIGELATVKLEVVFTNDLCPSATLLRSTPWIAIDGVTGQWIYPQQVPAFKTWGFGNCGCQRAGG